VPPWPDLPHPRRGRGRGRRASQGRPRPRHRGGWPKRRSRRAHGRVRRRGCPRPPPPARSTAWTHGGSQGEEISDREWGRRSRRARRTGLTNGTGAEIRGRWGGGWGIRDRGGNRQNRAPVWVVDVYTTYLRNSRYIYVMDHPTVPARPPNARTHVWLYPPPNKSTEPASLASRPSRPAPHPTKSP
jgi:hypothetical protein